MTDEPNRKNTAQWNAGVYHRISQPQFEWGLKVLDRLPLRGDEIVMDAGCGTGRLIAELLKRLPQGRVIAVDASENMLQLARQHLVPTFDSRVAFLCADLQDMRLDEKVDAIFSTAAFHWVTDHPRLFSSLYRTLKPSGRLLAQCGGGPNLAHLLDRARMLMESDKFARYFADWSSPWEYADAATTAARLRAAGFDEVETGLEPAPIILADEKEYREYLTNAIFRLHLAQMDKEVGAEFISALTQAAARDNPRFRLDYWRLNMRASKRD